MDQRNSTPPTVSATSCPVSDKGLELREVCSDCDGHPSCGQLAFPRRAPLYLEGDPADAIFTIVEGFVRETRSTPDGRAQGIRLVGPGSLAGTEALRSPLYQTSAEALTPVRACKVPVAAAERRMAAHPRQALAVIGALGEELAAVRDSVLWLGTFTAEERILAMLGQLSCGAPKGTAFRLPITRLEIAELLGLAHATVSRTMHRLARQGTLEIAGRWITVLA